MGQGFQKHWLIRVSVSHEVLVVRDFNSLAALLTKYFIQCATIPKQFLTILCHSGFFHRTPNDNMQGYFIETTKKIKYSISHVHSFWTNDSWNKGRSSTRGSDHSSRKIYGCICGLFSLAQDSVDVQNYIESLD